MIIQKILKGMKDKPKGESVNEAPTGDSKESH